MGIEHAASVVASSQTSFSGGQSAGGQNTQISELQRLEQSIRKMKEEYRTSVQGTGVSGAGVQTKLREFDDLIAKVSDQIHRLQQEDKNAAVSDQKQLCSGNKKKLGVPMLYYNTAVTMVELRNSG